MQTDPHPARHRLLVALTAAAGALALQAGTAFADASPPALQLAPRGAGVTAPMPPEMVIKHLPGGQNELMFRGESASRSFTVQLGRTEAARTTTFQLALLNAVSLLPERSVVKLTVNGTVLAAVQAGSTDKPTLHPIRIPPGLLVPGANTVRISATLSHRVDCSVQATYELWAMLEAAQTGFMTPRDVASSVRSVDDLALEPLAADGTTRIHLRIGDYPDPAEVSRAAGLIDAISRRAGLVRPVVDVGPDRGTGAGFDVVLSGTDGLEKAADGLTIIGRNSGVVLGRDSATNRLVVIVSAGADAVAMTPAATTVLAGRLPIKQGFRKTLAELGLPTEIFAGRHYTSTIDVTLPPDFLASSDRARLLLDGSHAGSLVEGSGLVFRVNGTLVSSMSLAAGKAERLQHAIVELPLRFFHPGHNELSIEGTTSATADAQCDTMAMPREPRLTIAGSSELDFPSFAHLATLPQIPAAMAYDADAAGGSTALYLPATDRASLGAGLTALANLALSQERIGAPQIRFGMPAESDMPGIVVAASGELPDYLGEVLTRISTSAPVPTDTSVAAEPVTVADAAGTTNDTIAPTDPALPAAGGIGASAPFTSESMASQGASILAAAQTMLRDRGFFFAGDQKGATLPVAPGSLLIAAVAPQATFATVGGMTLPRVTRDATHWLVITAADRDITQATLAQLIGSGRWGALAGQAVSFDPKADTLNVLQPHTVSYVLPDRLVVSDLRPILGGVMSDNILLSVGVMLVLMTILGMSTHVVIRRMGVR